MTDPLPVPPQAITAAERDDEHGRRIVSAIFACGSEDCPRPFALYRHQDVSGVSGVGTVAHGTQFADGQVVIRWLGAFPSTVVWNSLDDAMRVHGHDGKTRVVWLAAEFYPMAEAEAEAVAAERERCAQLAEQVDAQYPWYHAAGGIQQPVAFRPFAALLREARP